MLCLFLCNELFYTVLLSCFYYSFTHLRYSIIGNMKENNCLHKDLLQNSMFSILLQSYKISSQTIEAVFDFIRFYETYEILWG